MPEDLFHFRWHVAKSGYKWDADEELVEVADEDSENSYNPLEETGLFRTFSETDPTPEGILEFANQYGPLLAATESVLSNKERDSYSLWRDTILSMRQVIKLWDLIQKRDKKKLSAYFHLEKSQVIRGRHLYFDGKPGQEIVMSSDDLILMSPGYQPDVSSVPEEVWPIPEEAMARVRRGDSGGAALNFINLVIGRRGHLEGRVSPRLLWNTKRTQLQLRFVPRNLMGALWLQCAEMINYEKKYQQCKQCDKWFEISQKEMNKGKAFCSNACRSRAYRERQLEAQRLYTDGVSIKSIAGRLDSDEKIVEGWIKEGKR